MKQLTIRQKLIGIMLLTSIISLATVLFFTTSYSAKFFKQDHQKDLEIITSLISENLTSALAFDDYARAQSVLNTLSSNQSIEQACLYDIHGKNVAKYSSSDKSFCDSNKALKQASQNSQFLLIEKEIKEGQTFLGNISIRSNSYELQAFVRKQMFFVIVIAGAICVLISLPLANLLQKSISSPIYKLVDTSQKLPQTAVRTNRLTYKDELMNIEEIMQDVFHFTKNMELEVGRLSAFANAIKSNKDMTLKYLQEETKNATTTSEFMDYVATQKSLGSIDDRYMNVSEVTSQKLRKLQSDIKTIYDLSERENQLASQPYKKTNLKDLISMMADNNFSYYGSKVQVNFNHHNGNLVWPIKTELFKEILTSIFNIFKYLGNLDQTYILQILAKEQQNDADKNLIIKFEYSLDAKHNNESDSFDFEGDSFIQDLIKAKYLSNLHSPARDDNPIHFKFYDTKFVINLKLNWHESNQFLT